MLIVDTDSQPSLHQEWQHTDKLLILLISQQTVLFDCNKLEHSTSALTLRMLINDQIRMGISDDASHDASHEQ